MMTYGNQTSFTLCWCIRDRLSLLLWDEANVSVHPHSIALQIEIEWHSFQFQHNIIRESAVYFDRYIPFYFIISAHPQHYFTWPFIYNKQIVLKHVTSTVCLLLQEVDNTDTHTHIDTNIGTCAFWAFNKEEESERDEVQKVNLWCLESHAQQSKKSEGKWRRQYDILEFVI